MDDIAHLSTDELSAQLQALSARRQALEEALVQQREAEQRAFIEELEALISERGYALEEIVERLQARAPRPKRRRQRAANDAGGYTRYADPDNPNHVYVRGRMPTWLVEKMSANGFDPNDAEQRAQFKAQHLIALAA